MRREEETEPSHLWPQIIAHRCSCGEGFSNNRLAQLKRHGTECPKCSKPLALIQPVPGAKELQEERYEKRSRLFYRCQCGETTPVYSMRHLGKPSRCLKCRAVILLPVPRMEEIEVDPGSYASGWFYLRGRWDIIRERDERNKAEQLRLHEETIRQWFKVFGTKKVFAKDIFSIVKGSSLQFYSLKGLSAYISRNKNRVVDGLKVVSTPYGGTTRYNLERVEDDNA